MLTATNPPFAPARLIAALLFMSLMTALGACKPTENKSDATMNKPTTTTPKRQLLIFLHGVGSSGQDVRGVAQALASARPDTIVLTPDGPFPFDGNPQGRQWYSLYGVNEHNRLQRTVDALPALDALIKDALKTHQVEPEQLTLAGFSQGAIMAMSWAAQGNSCAGIIAFSGRLPDGLPITATQTPITLIHGTQDNVIGHRFAQDAQARFKAAGQPVALHTLPMGHMINDQALTHGREAFLASHEPR